MRVSESNEKKGRRSGRTLPFLYYIAAIGRELIPRPLRRLQRWLTLRNWEKRPDADYIRSRVDFYCRRHFRSCYFSVKASDIKVGKITCPSSYIYDVRRYLRGFQSSLLLNFFGGDTFANPGVPTIMRSRRLDFKCDNGVLLNLDSRRHFLRPQDPVEFSDKKPLLLFRGVMKDKPHRIRFFEMWKDSPLMDIADTTPPYDIPGHSRPLSIADHFDYQFILVLEGNDVASALQWVMASNCVPVMTRPTVEGWLMHSRLIPGVHYIQIADDFSDVEEKIRYYTDHSHEAELIARESKEWAKQFNDTRRENIISYLVLEKYFRDEDS
ncbi:MAG: lipopolysaccharide biosynthesis protein [Muribaculaceae bacterium]|nr:lipopolysaccharide biosynthesis protein [Muribaculaceae bacterium]